MVPPWIGLAETDPLTCHMNTYTFKDDPFIFNLCFLNQGLGLLPGSIALTPLDISPFGLT